MAPLGEVVVVAPDAERSAVGHAITTLTPLRVKEVSLEGGFRGYACNGTPADSVKLALGALLDPPPDLVVSGVNLGPTPATTTLSPRTVPAATAAPHLAPPIPGRRAPTENTHGLLRQYFPTGTDLARWGAQEIQSVAHALNTRPRKTLGWKTPAEALNEHLKCNQKPCVATTG